MHSPRQFFDELMSPFVFLPLLEFTFEGCAHTRQGAEFFNLFFYNLFVAQPHEAALYVMEVNFGFEASANQETCRQINARLQAISGDPLEYQEESKDAVSTATGGSSGSQNRTPG